MTRELNLEHLYRMTDEVGMFQHAHYSLPDPAHGYCVDDNARALIAVLRAFEITGVQGLTSYIDLYLRFVERCQRPDGAFHNFMSAEGQWLDEVGSEDSHGRAAWALGFVAARSAESGFRERALRCLRRALPCLSTQTWLRANAFTLLGLQQWQTMESLPELRLASEQLADRLAQAYMSCAGEGWQWFENQLTYSNAVLSQALLGTKHRDIGLVSLAWLCQVMELPDRGCMRLIGNQGWFSRGGQPAEYDQQAVDARHTVTACVAAHRVSGDDRFKNWGQMAYEWFLGRNTLGASLIDPSTGGCFDGLSPTGPNLNQGAESLLAWLLATEDVIEAGWG